MELSWNFKQAALRTAVIMVLLPASTGCGRGDGIERVVMSGKVTHQGQPVADGEIRFRPAEGTSAPITIERIVNGEYRTTMSGGVPVGSHRVEIRAYNPEDPLPQGPGDPQRRQLLPPQYNSQSTLTITVESGQSRLTQDFEL